MTTKQPAEAGFLLPEIKILPIAKFLALDFPLISMIWPVSTFGKFPPAIEFLNNI